MFLRRAIGGQFGKGAVRIGARAYSTGRHDAKRRWMAILGGSLLFSSGLYIGQRNGDIRQDGAVQKTSCTTALQDIEAPVYATLEDLHAAFEEIRSVVGADNVTMSETSRKDHSDTYFNSHHATEEQRPYAVVYPNSTAQVSRVMKICTRYRVPVVPYSGGTSLEGHYIPTRGGICLDMNNMNKIVEVHEKDLDVVVQPGVPWEDLGDFLSEKGLMFGCDPGPTAEIGGMVATSCSGTNAARYGTMKENVLSLTVVLADGTVIKTRNRPRKSSAGYNLTNLFVGSEGTLGIVTEVTLKLWVKPHKESIAVVSYDSIEDAARTVENIVDQGIQVNAVELLDDKMMKCINEAGQTEKKWNEKPTLFFKLGGNTERGMKELISTVEKIAKQNRNHSFEFAENEEEKLELWQARKVALWSTIDYGRTLDKDIQIWTTDVAVPVSRLAKVLKETKVDMEQSGLTATLVGHVGDGNFHAFLLYNQETRKTAEKLVDRMVKRALDNEGTCTGEHGVGFGKREYLIQEVGNDTINLMRHIKLALDPLRILNTDKVIHVDPSESVSH